MSVLVILNPWAGRGSAAKAKPRLVRALKDVGTPWDLVETTGPGHAMGIAREAVAAGVTRLICASGDGVIHEVVNALMHLPPTEDGGTPASVGALPLGTGNDFHKLLGSHGVPLEVAVSRMFHADTQLFDVGKVNGEYFDNIFGVGFDAETVRNAIRMKRLRGVALYVASIYRTFVGFRPPVLEVVTAEHRETGPMMMCAVNIGICGAGKFYLTPQADPRDGKLDVCLIRKVGLLRFLTAVPQVAEGTHGALDEVSLFQTHRATIRSADDRPLVLQLDGELREPDEREVEITIEPRRLRVLMAG
jgi:YegS/Rv2252/BmrU family lipid kinase